MDTSSLIPMLAIGTFIAIVGFAAMSFFRNRSKRKARGDI